MDLFLAVSKMLAGVGLFILGMGFIETALRRLAGRSFKLFLRNHTSNKFTAIGGGAIVTGVLQSSSIVNLMVLAFVGAGVLTFRNALAIILGANIGTTLSSWVVALLGFSFNIELLSLPLVGVAGIAMAMLPKMGKAQQWSRFLFGFGALFVGLDFMKMSFQTMVLHFDFQQLQYFHALVFVLVGFLLTTIIQSSSATVAITLSALNVNAVDLFSATAIVLGSELGTTIKLLIASVNGVPAKKRVALGNFMYNAILLVIIYFTLRPIHQMLLYIIGVNEPLIALVFFQSFINIAGVLLFFPFLNAFEKFLLRMFTNDESVVRYIQFVPAGEGDLSLDALDKEARRFLLLTLDYHLQAFHISGQNAPEVLDKSFPEQYDYLKLLHGEIHSYFITMNKDLLNDEERQHADQIISAVRNCMFSAKSIKDSYADIDQLRNSSSDTKFQVYHDTRREVENLHKMLMACMTRESSVSAFESIVALYNRIQDGYARELKKLYRLDQNPRLTDVDISTLINFNREFFAAYKAMVWAIKDYLLDKDQARYFAELPGFIR